MWQWETAGIAFDSPKPYRLSPCPVAERLRCLGAKCRFFWTTKSFVHIKSTLLFIQPTMNPAVSNLVLMLVAMQVSRKLDFEDPATLFWVRVAFCTGNGIALAVYFYLQYAIKKKNDLTTLKYVEPPNTMAGETEPKLVVTTVKDYDLAQVQSTLKSLYTSLAMTAFMHLYMKFANPLVIQSVSPIKAIFENPEVKINLLNEPATGDLKRPFKKDAGLFGAATGQGGVKTDKASIEKAERAGTGGIKEE